MKRILPLFACLVPVLFLLSCQEGPLPAEKYLQHKRVLFLGNSITQNGAYVSFIQYFLQKHFPDWETDIISIGLSSETVSCLTENDHPFPRPCLRERLTRALELVQPDVVVACYGMNDGIYHPPGLERLQAYQQGVRDLIDKARSRGASVVLLTPPPFDPLPIRERLVGIDAPEFGYKTPYENYDDVLKSYARWLRRLASDDIAVIDWHTAVNRRLEEMRGTDPEASFAQDGIHPSPEGHLFMAKIFLEAFGLNEPAIAGAALDAIYQDRDFQRTDDQRRMRSAAALAYAGYTRGEKVASLSPKPLLVLMGGQSNMAGSGRREELSEPNLPETVKFIDFGLYPNRDMQPDPANFGPEVGLARTLSEAFPQQPVILLKYAVGGSSLLDWAPAYDPAQAEITGNPQFGPLYQKFFQQIDSVVQLYDPEITALLWMQGERDARIPEAGEDYGEHLRALITAFRSRLGKEDLPFILGVVNPPLSRYPALQTVQEAQRRAATELPAVYTFETEGLSKHADEVHYDTEGQVELGRLFGNVLTDVIRSRRE